MNNSEQPAFPFSPSNEYDYIGMTKREYFAAMAMQGLLSNRNILRPNPDSKEFENQRLEFSRVCIEYADDLLSSLEQSKYKGI
ncbi:MAG TPA: hypothetical protein VFD46_07085 [Chryseolinea sp.]|nr:hypothetical protein [Chryseolinea sp.]